ncbi:MAG: 30S ribosomal protein S18 [Dehalococcoidia bacterium]|nr:30S ribosomal protein S18 [Dehalococcoidia bacterium]
MAMTRSSGPTSRGPGGGADRPRGGRPRYVPKRRVCAFCADKSKVIDFRDATKLRRYISERAKIEGRRKTATCSKHQRQMAEAIKRARHLAMLPFVLAHIRQSGIGGYRSMTGRFGPPGERPQFAPPAAAQPVAAQPVAAQPVVVQPVAAQPAVPAAQAAPVPDQVQPQAEAAESAAAPADGQEPDKK